MESNDLGLKNYGNALFRMEDNHRGQADSCSFVTRENISTLMVMDNLIKY